MYDIEKALRSEGIDPDPKLVTVIQSMDIHEKVGQMFLLAFGGEDPGPACSMIARYHLGGCYLGDANADSASKARALAARLQASACSSGRGIPLLLGADQEGAWSIMSRDSVTGPGNLGLGAAGDPESTAAMYSVLGTELAAVGYNTLLAPCADVNSNPRNPIIGMRSFGSDPDAVAAQVAAAVRGALSAEVIATVKHFPGHGDTAQDSHRGIPRVDRDLESIRKIDLAPFVAGIQAGAGIVMTAHIIYSALDPDYPATLSRRILWGLLREELGFGGLILSDSMNMAAMRKNYETGESAAQAVAAGVDMIMLAEEHYDHDASLYQAKQVRTIQGVLEAVDSGRIPLSRIDASVYRILDLKRRALPYPETWIEGRGAEATQRGPAAASPVSTATATATTTAFPTTPASAATTATDTTTAADIVGCQSHRAIEAEVASRLVCPVHNHAGRWPLPATGTLAVIRCARKEASAILTATRGIGPNQSIPAFDAFAAELVRLRPDCTVLDYHRLADPAHHLRDFGTLVAVTEDYPLPGVDFDTESQKKAVTALAQHFGDRLVVIGLRSPYELEALPMLATYVTTCSSRPCAAVAAARAACGLIPSEGRLPVQLALCNPE